MSQADVEPKRRGRPPAPEQKRRRANLTFRIREDLKADISRSAEQSGNSISEEVEKIIESRAALERLISSKDSEIESLKALIETIHSKETVIERHLISTIEKNASAIGIISSTIRSDIDSIISKGRPVQIEVLCRIKTSIEIMTNIVTHDIKEQEYSKFLKHNEPYAELAKNFDRISNLSNDVEIDFIKYLHRSVNYYCHAFLMTDLEFRKHPLPTKFSDLDARIQADLNERYHNSADLYAKYIVRLREKTDSK